MDILLLFVEYVRAYVEPSYNKRSSTIIKETFVVEHHYRFQVLYVLIL